jgi:hypothetical protein
MTNTYDATYGLFRGGVVNTTTKSGTNSWHGDLFEFWRNSIFDANYFQNLANPNVDATTGAVTPKPYGLHNQHQFGGVVGGPVRKDKDFVFISYEGWQEVIPYPIVATTPPPAIRDGQHFTQYGIQVFDPRPGYCDQDGHQSTYRQASCNVNNPKPTTSTAVSGQRHPSSRISPIGAKIVSFWPYRTPGRTTGWQ